MLIISIFVCIYCHSVNSNFLTSQKFQLSNNINAWNNLAENGVHSTCTLHQRQENKRMYIIQIFIVTDPRKNRQYKLYACNMKNESSTKKPVFWCIFCWCLHRAKNTEDPLPTTTTHWTRTGPLQSRGHTGIGNHPCSSGRSRVHGTPLVHTPLQVQVERTRTFNSSRSYQNRHLISRNKALNFITLLLNSSFI